MLWLTATGETTSTEHYGCHAVNLTQPIFIGRLPLKSNEAVLVVVMEKAGGAREEVGLDVMASGELTDDVIRRHGGEVVIQRPPLSSVNSQSHQINIADTQLSLCSLPRYVSLPLIPASSPLTAKSSPPFLCFCLHLHSPSSSSSLKHAHQGCDQNRRMMSLGETSGKQESESVRIQRAEIGMC